MPPLVPSLQVLASSEAALASHEVFGHWRYIDGCTRAHYTRRVEMAAGHLPGAARLAAALHEATPRARYRVIGDAAVRHAIDAAVAHFKLDIPEEHLDAVEEILSAAAQHLTGKRSLPSLLLASRRRARIGAAAHHARIWDQERADDAFDRCFRDLFGRHLKDNSLRTTTDHEQQMLVQGTRLLETLLPKLARSVLPHAHLIALIEPFRGSVTNPNIPGVVFLSSAAVQTPWMAAEFLLHEALHLRFIDLEQTHSMLRAGYDEFDSPLVHPLWHRNRAASSQVWPTNRLLTVSHVYTSLALFFMVVERRRRDLEDAYGPVGIDPLLFARQAMDRAHFLNHAIRQNVAAELGEAGELFVEWLEGIMARLDPAPPAAGSYIHLLLDLYRRETEIIAARIKASNSPLTSVRIAGDMIRSEIGNAARVLEALRPVRPAVARRELDNLGKVTTPASPREAASNFRFVRKTILKTLSAVPPEVYHHPQGSEGAKTAAERFRELIADSDVYLDALDSAEGEARQPRRLLEADGA
jgi:hypothetical protein